MKPIREHDPPHRDLGGSYTAKFEEIFHYQGKEKDERLEEDTKKEIVHLYSDVYHKNGKPYLYDAARNRYISATLLWTEPIKIG